MSTSTIHLAGYQGSGSILTAALQRLQQRLVEPAPGLPAPFVDVQLQADVTATGQAAGSLWLAVERGEVQIAYMASSYLSARVPDLGVLDLPFSVSERNAALTALDGQAGALLRDAVAQHTGLHVLAFWDNGFRHISNAVRALRTPADCAGLVIRTLDSAHYRSLFAALGFTAVTTDVKELVQAVKTGAVQAQENPLTNLISFGLWPYQPHVSLTAHLYGVLLLLCPKAWFAQLSNGAKTRLQLAVSQATELQRQLAQEQDRFALAQLRGHGVQVLQAEQIDLAAMQHACAEHSAALRRQLPAALLDAYLPSTVH